MTLGGAARPSSQDPVLKASIFPSTWGLEAQPWPRPSTRGCVLRQQSSRCGRGPRGRQVPVGGPAPVPSLAAGPTLPWPP